MSDLNLKAEREDLGAELPETSSENDPKVVGAGPWPEWQKILFRIAFVFFIAMTLPNNPDWYTDIFAFDWLHLHYRDLYDIARFGSGLDFFGNRFFGSPLNGYAIWVITFVFAIAVGLIWTAVAYFIKKERREYNLLYYWLKVIVRYRAGIGIIGFGFTKLTPTQLPYPSWGILNTDFGDLTLQKIYWLSIGIVPWYEVFTGVVEVAAGALLFFRATTFWGSVLLFGALADIVYVNFAYDGGVHVYSSYFVLFSAFLLIDYVPKIYSLLIKERFTIPFTYYPVFDKAWQRITRITLKTVTIVLFLPVFLYLAIINFLYDPYKQPAQKGIKALRGNYEVSEFRINNQVIPYSPLDTVRWQQATFEKWTTLTFKTNKPVELDLSNGGGAPMRDIGRTFELTGVAGGQRVFYYEADTVNQVLYLQDKNRGARNQENREFQGNRNQAANGGGRGERNRPEGQKKDEKQDNWIPKEALAIIGPEDPKIDPIARSGRRTKGIESESRPSKRNRMILKYTVIDGGNRVLLSGINENKDSINVVLDRYTKKYALSRSTLEAGKYE
ncbi:hypothetical protein GVN16_24680 [Emticicia sp. CRIBPO]|uniref:hypothetical protein n=1 Tax=Emticicia sp. CRIBPO TaxID=2683258 RepID=UPI001413566C|nr:hypothetical protein [Emticicia sp. CRIBPO]NBA88995.1 hypothetical protein [Emticicia sp. CRIBPO]